jgi:hypothetical protein
MMSKKAGLRAKQPQQVGLLTMMKARQMALRTKRRAMDKLQSGKTLEYDPTTLGKASTKQLVTWCEKYHLSAKAEPNTPLKNTLRERLADLLVVERHRTQRYRTAQAAQLGDDAIGRADEHIAAYEMSAANWGDADGTPEV